MKELETRVVDIDVDDIRNKMESLASLLNPIPVNTVKSIIDDEPGADGVPIEAINAKTAINIIFWIVRV